MEKFIESICDDRIKLLKQDGVIKWLLGDVSFITSENEWGRKTMKAIRPDLKLNKQWTNRFGEILCYELELLLNHNPRKPKKINKLQPDLETDEYIIEVKTGTYNTEGTAHEKILGCPFKYAEIPELYGKPLKIVCIGGAEKRCKTQYGNLGKCSKQKQKFLDFYKQNGIEFVAFSDILKSLIPN